MKIHAALRRAWAEQTSTNSELKRRVDSSLLGLKSGAWHYESRLKSEESYATKVESGLSSSPDRLEDFLAAVLVVPNLDEVALAENIVLTKFQLDHRRPPSSKVTNKSSSSFPFDDVRLYLKIGVDDTLPPRDSDDVVFELQIRTFLQHAWTVSTHDTVFKADSVSWPRERISHQVKAMLEQAELTVQSLAELEKAPSLPNSERYDAVNRVIAILRANWTDDLLPSDLKRLANSLVEIAHNVFQGSDTDIAALLAAGKARYGNSHNADWSPYRAFLEYLCDDRAPEFGDYLKNVKRRSRAPRIYIYQEIAVKLALTGSLRNAILLPQSMP